MANIPPDADVVRAFKPQQDTRIVKMLIGQGIMEGLAYGNQKGAPFPLSPYLPKPYHYKLTHLRLVYTHPLVLAGWIALSSILNIYLNWIPTTEAWYTYLSPIIGLSITALPIMGIIEYIHRPSFTRNMRETIGAIDMVAIDRYYGLDEKSKVIVFEHKGEVSGVVALDGMRGGEELGTVLGAEEGELGDEGVLKEGFGREGSLKKRKMIGEGKGETDDVLVQIRHLDVDGPLRASGVITELVAAALDHAFGVNPLGGPISQPASQVIYLTNPLTPGGEKELKRCGFVSATNSTHWASPKNVGLLGWKGRWLQVDREQWTIRRAELYAKR